MHIVFGDVLRVALFVCGHELRRACERAHQSYRSRRVRHCTHYDSNRVHTWPYCRMAQDKRAAAEREDLFGRDAEERLRSVQR